jgi:hypothetical protein
MSIMFKTRNVLRSVIVALLAGCAAHSQAATLGFSFDDPAGDAIDRYITEPGAQPAWSRVAELTHVGVVFDNVTGDYTVTIRTAPDVPFVESGRFDFHFVNPDAGARTYEPYEVAGTRFYGQLTGQQTLSISGNSASLLQWEAGDRVATSSVPFGLAEDDSRTGCYTGHETFGGFDFLAPDAVTTITSVPEPAGVALWVLGLSFLCWGLRRARIEAPQA